MPGTTGSMANPRFLSQLPLAQIIANNDQQSRDSIAARVLPGNYRLLNQASQRCLSYSSRPAPHAPVTTTKAPEIVTGWSCGVPGVDDDLHQVGLLKVFWPLTCGSKNSNLHPNLILQTEINTLADMDCPSNSNQIK